MTFLLFFYLMWNNLIIATMQEIYFTKVPPLARQTFFKLDSDSESETFLEVDTDLEDLVRHHVMQPLRECLSKMTEQFMSSVIVYKSTLKSHSSTNSLCQDIGCKFCFVRRLFQNELQLLIAKLNKCSLS